MEFLVSNSDSALVSSSLKVQNITSSDLDLTLIVQLDRTILNSLEFSAQRKKFGIKKVSRKTDSNNLYDRVNAPLTSSVSYYNHLQPLPA